MSARDFMPFITGSGGPRVRYGRLTASSSFVEGDMVMAVDAGTLSTVPIDDSVAVVSDLDSSLTGGVAAMDGDTTRTDGFARDGTSGAADLISYYPWNDGTLFITKNYISAADTSAIPPGTIVGESLQIFGSNATTLSSNFEVSAAAAGVQGTDIQALVHSVLNVRKEPIQSTDTTTGVWVVFEIKADVGAA